MKNTLNTPNQYVGFFRFNPKQQPIKEVIMTGNELLNLALDICGLRKEDGQIPEDVSDLKQRALAAINIVLAENAVTDCRIRKCEHKVASLSSLDDTIDCSAVIASSVLPYGVARLLMLNEDEAFARALGSVYESAQSSSLKFGRARVQSIEEVYR